MPVVNNQKPNPTPEELAAMERSIEQTIKEFSDENFTVTPEKIRGRERKPSHFNQHMTTNIQINK